MGESGGILFFPGPALTCPLCVLCSAWFRAVVLKKLVGVNGSVLTTKQQLDWFEGGKNFRRLCIFLVGSGTGGNVKQRQPRNDLTSHEAAIVTRKLLENTPLERNKHQREMDLEAHTAVSTKE